jgi:hypothetical protein
MIYIFFINFISFVGGKMDDGGEIGKGIKQPFVQTM